MTNDMAFDALADPTRRRVLQLLGARPMTAGELARATRLSPPAMSRHLRILLAATLVDDRRGADDARTRVFRLRPDGLAPLHDWIDALRVDWDAQLDAFRRHADGTVRE
jgi:DNA-binding transcriptional ArsR family regulator